MPRKKLDVDQSLFGFHDAELGTSLHDEIVLWIKENAHSLAARLSNWRAEWDVVDVAERASKFAEAVERVKMDLRERIALYGRELANFDQMKAQGKEVISWVYDPKKKELAAAQARLADLITWQSLGEPASPELEVLTELERPVVPNGARRPAAYIDVVVRARARELFPNSITTAGDAKNLVWGCRWLPPRTFAFDAKCQIPSLGELIRQFTTYRGYWRVPYYIVSPDSKFAGHISDEGFGFITYPQGEITPPKTKPSWD